MWLATRAGKIEPSCLLGTTCCIPKAKFPLKPYNKSFIDQVCSVKIAGYWPRSLFAWAASTSAISAFWKTHKYELIPNWTRKTVWLLIKYQKIFLGAIFLIWELCSKFEHKIFVIMLCDIIGLENSYCLSANHNKCVICTGGTLFALVLHLNCTAFNQSEFVMKAWVQDISFTWKLLKTWRNMTLGIKIINKTEKNGKHFIQFPDSNVEHRG